MGLASCDSGDIRRTPGHIYAPDMTYSRAYDAMLEVTDRAEAPWTIIRANDKRRARLEVIRHILLSVDYEGKDRKAIGSADDRIVLDAQAYLRGGGEPGR